MKCKKLLTLIFVMFLMVLTTMSASVLMSDSGTPLDRTDDIIICAHYVGYKEVM